MTPDHIKHRFKYNFTRELKRLTERDLPATGPLNRQLAQYINTQRIPRIDAALGAAPRLSDADAALDKLYILTRVPMSGRLAKPDRWRVPYYIDTLSELLDSIPVERPYSNAISEIKATAEHIKEIDALYTTYVKENTP